MQRKSEGWRKSEEVKGEMKPNGCIHQQEEKETRSWEKNNRVVVPLKN